MDQRKYKLIRPFKFTPEDIVDLFLNLHARWFIESSNSLYGKREQARNTLLAESFKLPNELLVQAMRLEGTDSVYVVNKFETEWLGKDNFFVAED